MTAFSQGVAASIFEISLRTTRMVAQTSALVLAIIITASAAHAQTFTILHTFSGRGEGGEPHAGLTIDLAGNFYGTTSTGGAGYGTVFKLTHSGSNWVLSTLYTFQGGDDGGYPPPECCSDPMEISMSQPVAAPTPELVRCSGLGRQATLAGLLTVLGRRRCCTDSLCDSATNRFVLKATVYPSKDSAGFVGYGDADPSNVSLLVRSAEMRIAETRAVNRALRKAYGIGICSVEEIGSNSGPMAPAPDVNKFPPKSTNGNGNGNGSGHKVRDWLCQIIRQHKLDPKLVKAYAVDFCGTKALNDATGEQVEAFVQQLAEGGQE